MNPDNTRDEQGPGHQRRIRYTGTHPKTFREKYKELQPEQYADAVARVIQRGRTPAGMHLSICVDEILAFLQIAPGQTGLDATLGYGGHTLAMLKCLQAQGRLYAIDVDALELPRTKARLERLGYGPDILRIRGMNFSQIDKIVPESGPFDFILADLGVSSMQIDNPDRGFSFKHEGPLDLRLNPHMGMTAAQRLKTMSLLELEGMLAANADEPYAAPIARAIAAARRKGAGIATTDQLRSVIENALKPIPALSEDDIKKSCQRCFQALRIDVNRELEALADKLTVKDADGNVTRYGFIPWLDSGDDPLLWPFMFGAEIYDIPNNKLVLDDPSIISSLNWMNSYALKYSAEKIKGFTQSSGGLFSPDHPFFTQKVAMTVIGNWATNALRIYAPQVDYSVCAIPVPEGGRVESTPLGSNVFAIPVGAKNPELAAIFYAFCVRPEINGNNFDTWRSIPVIDRLFDDVSWIKAGDPIYTLGRKIANSPLSGHPGLCTVSSELRSEFLALRDNVIYNNSDPQPLLQALAAKLQPELDAVK